MHRLFDENIELKNEIKGLKKEIDNIKNINKVNLDIINNKCSEIYKINANSKKLKEKINKLYKTINLNNNTILKLHEEKFNLEKELSSFKEIKNPQIELNENNNLNNKNIAFNMNNIKLSSKTELKKQKINKNKNELKRIYSAEKQTEYIKSRLLGEIKSKTNINIKTLDNLESESKNRLSSTPSFKSMKDENEEIFEKKNDIKEDIQNEINNENNENFNLKYFENKYLYYFKLYQESKKSNEILKKEIIEKDELIQKLKNDFNNIININQKNEQTNINNLETTFSKIKINYQYNPNEFFILCDKTFGELKWFLMKKQIDYEKEDTYDNLIWVPKIDVIDLDKFNEYSNDDENSNLELIKVIKKLEEKENVISKLTYKIEKLEKDLDNYKNNSDFSDIYDEIFIKSKRKNKK